MKTYNITVNGVSYNVEVEELGASADTVVSRPTAPKASKPAAKKAAPKPTGGTGTVTAPMPGTILDVKVNVGQSVKAGDLLCVLEAMKMENEIVAPADGKVASVSVSKGDTVVSGDVLVTIE